MLNLGMMPSWNSGVLYLAWIKDLSLNSRTSEFGSLETWITVKEFINSSTEPLLTTNVFEYHCGHWFMVHHHSSLLLEGGNIFGPLANWVTDIFQFWKAEFLTDFLYRIRSQGSFVCCVIYLQHSKSQQEGLSIICNFAFCFFFSSFRWRVE